MEARDYLHFALAEEIYAIEAKDVEAVISANMEPFEGVYLPDHWMASEMAACGKPGFKVATGGTSGASGVIEGFHLVASGLVSTSLVVGFQKYRTR
jgi:acetyl-CoA acetyltransferase